jgi:hypothetical protein
MGDKDDVVVADDTHFPVIVATWHGAPSERSVRAYFAWLGPQLLRSKREGCPLVNVSDSGKAGVPDADVRRLIADLTKQWEAAGADDRRVTSIVVVENAVLRGVVSAIAWLHGSLKTSQYATCEEALDAALAVLLRAGRPAPPRLSPSRWRRPGRTPGSETDSAGRALGPREPDSDIRAKTPTLDPASFSRNAAGGKGPRR